MGVEEGHAEREHPSSLSQLGTADKPAAATIHARVRGNRVRGQVRKRGAEKQRPIKEIFKKKLQRIREMKARMKERWTAHERMKTQDYPKHLLRYPSPSPESPGPRGGGPARESLYVFLTPS